MFYSYDPENGIEFHDTADEARSRAESALDDAQFHAADSDWSWFENEHEISWGEVRGKVEMNKREMTPEEKAENPEWSFIVDPKLEDVPPEPVANTEASRAAGE